VAVALITNWRVNPGRNQEFLGLVGEAKKIHGRLGGRVRVWQAAVAGENSGNIGYVVEHDDLVAYANFTQKLQADPEWQAFLAKAFVANPTGTLLSTSLVNELTP